MGCLRLETARSPKKNGTYPGSALLAGRVDESLHEGILKIPIYRRFRAAGLDHE